MTFEDISLLREAAQGAPDHSGSPEVAWHMYVRWLFRADVFHSFGALGNKNFFYVAENKSFPGRDEILEGQAMGRDLSVVWFSELAGMEEHEEGLIVVPCARDDENLIMLTQTVAEIARTAGLWHAPKDNDTARDVERWLGHGP